MSSFPKLTLAWATYEAAKYAATHWHYSRSLSASVTCKIGVWENDRPSSHEAGDFMGVVIFSHGALQHLGRQFGLTMFQCVELTRVALKPGHKTAVSRVVSIALRLMKRENPGVRLVISYSDVDREHIGGIYQAGNWFYLGMKQEKGGTPKFLIHGKVRHARSIGSCYGTGSAQLPWIRKHLDPNAVQVMTAGKHKYAMPLDAEMREVVKPFAKPYPKRAGSDTQDTAGDQLAEGGSTPTPALQTPPEAS